MDSETNDGPGNAQAELKQVLGAILFAARQPLTVNAVRKILAETAQSCGDITLAFGKATETGVRKGLEELARDVEAAGVGLHLTESAEGFRFQTDPAAGPWVRHMLDVGKPTRLSRPALETLAVIAYRQPVSRADIEAVRGVTVDHIIRLLLEMQVVKIVGRSELPGRPMLYGTTPLFLEHFGLKEIRQLPGIEELARIESVRQKQAADAAAAEAQQAEPAASGEGPAPRTEAAQPPTERATEKEQSNES